MAQTHSPLALQGQIGNLIFARTALGGTRAYLKPAKREREQWLRTTAKTLCGVSAMEFGGAAMAGSAIYRDICHGKAERAHFAPYTHNKIAKALRAHAPRTLGPCDRYHGVAALPALRKLNLGHPGSPADPIRILPIGPAQQPTHLRIGGIREAAAQVAASTDGLEVQISIRSTQFQEVAFDQQAFAWAHASKRAKPTHHTTLWLPIDLVPAAGITLELPAAATEGQPTFHFLVLKWRRLRHRRQPQALPRLSVIKYAAASIPEGTFAEAAAPARAPKPGHLSPGARFRLRRPDQVHGRPATRRQHIKKALPSLYFRLAINRQSANRPPS